MASPSHNPSPGESPKDPTSFDPPAPSLTQMRAALEHGRERLITCFQSCAQLKGWTVLDTQAETQWRELWQEALRTNCLQEVGEDLSGARDALQFRILAVARDEDAMYSLVCFEDITKGTALVVGTGNELVNLTFGAHAARLLAVPIDSVPEDLQALDEDADEESPIVFEMLFLDPRSFTLEARKFGAGDTSGLIGDIFLDALACASSEELEVHQQWEISQGYSEVQPPGIYSFACAGSYSGNHLFEVELDPHSNFINQSLLTPVSSKVPGSEDDSTARSATRTARALIAPEEVLERLGYREVETLPVPGKVLPAEVFQNGIRTLFKDWAPKSPWRVHFESCFAKPNDPEGVLLVHAYVLDSAGRYLLPFFKGSTNVTSEEPIGIFVEARREQMSETSALLRFWPRMLQLSPDMSLETLIAQSLPDLPNSLLGSYALAAVKQRMDARSIHWLKGPIHGHLLCPASVREDSGGEELSLGESHSQIPRSDTASLSPEAYAGLLCFHSRGAHKLLLNSLPGGLVDLATSIQLGPFFPELPAFS